MSSMEITLIRSGDTRLLRAEIRLGYLKKYDFATISLVCGEQNLEIISTSSGKLIDNQIEVGSGIGNLNSYVEYCTQDGWIECLIGYYKNHSLVHHENLTGSFDNHQSVRSFSANIPKMKSVRSSFEKRFDDFKHVAEIFRSSWNIHLEHRNDFILTFVSKGKSKTMLCFGELSDDILASDYIFSIDPEVDRLSIPVEIFNHKYDQYSTGCKIGVFELIKPDFVAVSNLYYKTLISKTISLHEIVNKK